MSSTTTRSAEHGLVPLADRLRYMQILRCVMAATVTAAWLAIPDARGLTGMQTTGYCVLYVVLTLPTLLAWRLPRRIAVAAFGPALLFDGLFLAWVTYGHSGLGTPLTYLLLLHVVSVTLLASFRTGLKIALWHSLLVGAAYQLTVAGYVDGIPPQTLAQLVLLITAIWLVTIATASFGAVNERELRRRNYDLRALSRFGLRLETTSESDAIANELVDAVVDEFGISRALLIASATGEPHLLAGRGITPTDAQLLPGGDAVVNRAKADHKPLRLKRADPVANPWLSAVMPDARNIVAVRLFSENHALGVLIFEHHGDLGRIERRIVEMVEQFVSHTALALQNAWLLAQIRALAATDGLTGIANRRTFETELDREIGRADRSGLPVSVVLVDIDHFKRHNDEYGHQQGDRTLQLVAAALSEAGRGADLAARYGGEEFVVVLPNTDLAGATAIAERLRVRIAAASELPVTASFGVAAFPEHGSTPGDVVRAADHALYESKRAGRNRVTAAADVPLLQVVHESDVS
ncbi:MAG: sensor domain-containing diguanylate cyclase [Mycobacteriales bacterium]